MDFKETINYVEFNEQGKVCFIRGICTAKDLRKEKDGGK
jgi:hypothetical protein